jgi:hypothetical protein
MHVTVSYFTEVRAWRTGCERSKRLSITQDSAALFGTGYPTYLSVDRSKEVFDIY